MWKRSPELTRCPIEEVVHACLVAPKVIGIDFSREALCACFIAPKVIRGHVSRIILHTCLVAPKVVGNDFSREALCTCLVAPEVISDHFARQVFRRIATLSNSGLLKVNLLRRLLQDRSCLHASLRPK